MKSFVEAKKELVETGRCAKSYRGPQGEPLCANKEVAWSEFNYVYEQNVCKRTMKFQEQCGPTIEGLREIASGERWDPLRDSCIKVY